ncbi:MAG: hypothetical protein ACREPQ_14645 [Rhodanobacter sp.]
MTSRLTVVAARFPAGSQPRLLRELSPAATQAVIRVCTDGQDPDEAQTLLVANLLNDLAAQRAWLLCSCVGEDLASLPVMYPRRTQANTRALVRNYDRAAHSDKCPFHRLRSERVAPAEKVATPPYAGACGILRVVAPADAAQVEHSAVGGRQRNSSVPLLGRILYSFLEEARLNVIPPEGPAPIQGQYQALREVLERRSWDDDKTLSVGKFAITSLDNSDWLIERLTRSPRWPHPLAPQGFLLGNASEVDGQVIRTTRGSEIEVKGKVALPGEDSCGPYLALLLYGRAAGAAKIEPATAFVTPIYRGNMLLPVDSDLERRTLAILLRQQSWLNLQKNLKVTITKPLSDIPVSHAAAKAVRPDFLVTLPGRGTVVVETMGYSTEEYLERKARLHPAMESIGKVVAHGHGDTSDHDFRSALASAIFGLLRG